MWTRRVISRKLLTCTGGKISSVAGSTWSGLMKNGGQPNLVVSRALVGTSARWAVHSSTRGSVGAARSSTSSARILASWTDPYFSSQTYPYGWMTTAIAAATAAAAAGWIWSEATEYPARCEAPLADPDLTTTTQNDVSPSSSASLDPSSKPHHDDLPIHRICTRQGLRDPLTKYQVEALQRELQEGGEEDQQPRSPVPAYISEKPLLRFLVTGPAVQATSAAATEAKPSEEGYVAQSDSFMERALAEERIEEASRKAMQHSGGLKVFSGNGNMSLALEICRHLGINLGKATVGRFADGECNVVIHENVRGKDVYVVQPTCPPVNDNIMELLLIVSTLRRASAGKVTVLVPYYGYARQDRKMQARVPISAADVARLMEAIGVDRVVAVDLHCGQIQGFFGPRVPVDNLDGGVVGLDYFGSKDLHNPVIVSPDAGGVYRAKKFKEGLEHKYDMQDLGLAMIVKQRKRAGSVDQMDLVGDVKDCDCIIVDDMIDTAGTLCKAAEVLIENGARRVFAFASHGLLSGPGNERIAHSKMEEVVILNTIPTSPQREANEKLTELSVAPLLAQAIFNIHTGKSVSALFK